jgi:hypothetical protein
VTTLAALIDPRLSPPGQRQAERTSGKHLFTDVVNPSKDGWPRISGMTVIESRNNG